MRCATRTKLVQLQVVQHQPHLNASDGERTFVFIYREYVKEFAPASLKGLSKLGMQAKVRREAGCCQAGCNQARSLGYPYHLEPG